MKQEDKKILSQELKDRKIDVKEDGSIETTELTEIKFKQNYRSFLTDVRNLEKYKADIEKTLTEEFKTEQEKNLTKLDEELKKLEPYLKQSEDNFLNYQKIKRKEDMVNGFKKLLNSDKKKDNALIMNIFEHIKKQDANFLNCLTNEERAKFKQIQLEFKRKKK